jgi:hypothetical protein
MLIAGHQLLPVISTSRFILQTRAWRGQGGFDHAPSTLTGLFFFGFLLRIKQLLALDVQKKCLQI